jgi:hypothetical protein
MCRVRWLAVPTPRATLAPLVRILWNVALTLRGAVVTVRSTPRSRRAGVAAATVRSVCCSSAGLTSSG